MTTALFLLDTAMNALMLALAVRFCGGRICPGRILLAAVVGAAVAKGARLLALERAQGMMLWLPAAALMMRIAMGGGAGRLIPAAVLFGAAGFTGGMVLSLWGATGSLGLAYALGGAAAAGAGVCAVRTRRIARQSTQARIACIYRGRNASFEAMIDSGNTLRDYLTHLPVIVIPQAAAQRALDMEGALLRPIFAETAGGRQCMSVFSPQEIRLQCRGADRCVQAVIALSPQMSAGVPALVPAVLLEEPGNSNRGG